MAWELPASPVIEVAPLIAPILSSDIMPEKLPSLRHDPYQNPNAILVYECVGCDKELNCNTKSFARLNTYASEMNWRIRWGEASYKAYCAECAVLRGVE